MIPSRTDPVSHESPDTVWSGKRPCIIGTSIMIPRRPYTTDGMPAMTSMMGFTFFLVLGEAISER